MIVARAKDVSPQVVPLADPPDPLARVAAVPLGGEPPERVPGTHDVALLARRAAGRTGDSSSSTPTTARRARSERDDEHVFAW